MTYEEAVKVMDSKKGIDPREIEALAVLRRAEKVMGAIEGAHPEDVARNLTAASNYCARIVVEVNGYVNGHYQGRALLDSAQKPESGSEERERLLTRLSVISDHYKDTMFHGDWPVLGVQVHNGEVEKIRALVSGGKGSGK